MTEPKAAETPPRPIAVVSVRTLVSAALLVLLVVALVMALTVVTSTLLLMLVAIVIAEGVRPLVNLAERGHIPRVAAILVVYVAVIAALAVIVTLLVSPIISEATTLSQQAPTYVKDAQPLIDRVQTALNLQTKNINLSQDLQNSLTSAGSVALSVGGYIVGLVVDLILLILLGFLWLVSSDRLKAFVVDLFPVRQQPLAADVIREMGFRMGGYLRATAINMAAVGIATGVAAVALGLPSPVLVGIFAGLASAIPLVGAIVGAIPPILLGFTIAPAYPILVGIVMIVVQLLDANLVLPQVMNRVVALPALAVVLALLVGGAFAGIVGALLAIPLAAAAQVLVLRVIVPAVHHSQGRADEAFAAAATPLSPALRSTGPTGGGRRSQPR